MKWLLPLLLLGATGNLQAVTFTRDVAPILYRRCAICHHQGGSGPFPLVTYQDAARRATQIAKVTASRFMPPWKPVPGYGDFRNEMALKPFEIATFQRWAATGARQGNPTLLPPPPQFPTGWQGGEPQQIVEMPRPFTVPEDGPDLYRCFVLKLNPDRDRWVNQVEFRTGNPRVVHHALLFTDPRRAGRPLESEPGGGYPCFGTPGFLPGSGLGGWSPGAPPVAWPEGVALPLARGSDLVLQVHFHPSGKPEKVQVAVGLKYADAPPKRPLMDVALTSNQIDIPAGETDYRVTDHFTLPVDVEALAVIPHAHYLCKEVHAWAILPDGRKKWLLQIRDFDFNWQGHFWYREPFVLPAGTRLEMMFRYDNSAANPRNPNHPPQRVHWGPGSGDEMAGLHLQVLPRRAEDAHELGMALWGKIMRSVGGRFYTLP